MRPRHAIRELLLPGLLLEVSALFFLQSVAGFSRQAGVYRFLEFLSAWNSLRRGMFNRGFWLTVFWDGGILLCF